MMDPFDPSAPLDLGAPPSVDAVAPPLPDPVPAQRKADVKRWQARLAAARKKRDRLMETWKDSVGFRVQKPTGSMNAGDTPAGDRMSLPEDWARTKQKSARPRTTCCGTRPARRT